MSGPVAGGEVEAGPEESKHCPVRHLPHLGFFIVFRQGGRGMGHFSRPREFKILKASTQTAPFQVSGSLLHYRHCDIRNSLKLRIQLFLKFFYFHTEALNLLFSFPVQGVGCLGCCQSGLRFSHCFALVISQPSLLFLCFDSLDTLQQPHNSIVLTIAISPVSLKHQSVLVGCEQKS